MTIACEVALLHVCGMTLKNISNKNTNILSLCYNFIELYSGFTQNNQLQTGRIDFTK